MYSFLKIRIRGRDNRSLLATDSFPTWLTNTEPGARSQELPVHSHTLFFLPPAQCSWQGPKQMGHFPLYTGFLQGTGLRVEQQDMS